MAGMIVAYAHLRLAAGPRDPAGVAARRTRLVYLQVARTERAQPFLHFHPGNSTTIGNWHAPHLRRENLRREIEIAIHEGWSWLMRAPFYKYAAGAAAGIRGNPPSAKRCSLTSAEDRSLGKHPT